MTIVGYPGSVRANLGSRSLWLKNKNNFPKLILNTEANADAKHLLATGPRGELPEEDKHGRLPPEHIFKLSWFQDKHTQWTQTAFLKRTRPCWIAGPGAEYTNRHWTDEI